MFSITKTDFIYFHLKNFFSCYEEPLIYFEKLKEFKKIFERF